MNKLKETFRILNPKQIDTFIKNGCTPIGCGVGRGNKIYVDFKNDDHFCVILKKWQNHEFNK